MNETITILVNKVDELVRLAGGKIEGFFPYAVVQQGLIGWICILWTVACVIIVGVCVLIVMRGFKADDPDVYMTGTIFGIIFILVGVTIFSFGFTRIINTEYHAVRCVIDMLSGLVPQG